MANALSIYDPIFYAQNALIALEKALGMAGRVYRGYDKNPAQRGSTIQIRVPSTFTAQAAPGSDMDIVADYIGITLDQWYEVKFALTDKELAYTGEQIVNEHIRPAAYALADKIDQDLCLLATDVPWTSGTSGTTPSNVSDITGARKVLFNNNCPMDDLHMMIDGNAEDKFLQLAAFSQWQGAGDQGANTQQRGTLGTKFGFEVFANQNVKSVTAGTASTTTLAINNTPSGYAIGASVINLDAGAVTGTLKKGDILAIAGDTQKYAVQADVTASGNAFAGVQISPKLKKAAADNAVVTVTLVGGSGATSVNNLAFNRNAFALAMAPLSEMGDGIGARIASVSDPITGLALRSRVWYEGNNSKVHVGLDVLYGYKTLDPNRAVRLLG